MGSRITYDSVWAHGNGNLFGTNRTKKWVRNWKSEGRVSTVWISTQPPTSPRFVLQRETPKQKIHNMFILKRKHSDKKTQAAHRFSCETRDPLNIQKKNIHTEEENQVAHSYLQKIKYGVATISRLLKMIGLFCRI